LGAAVGTVSGITAGTTISPKQGLQYCRVDGSRPPVVLTRDPQSRLRGPAGWAGRLPGADTTRASLDNGQMRVLIAEV